MSTQDEHNANVATLHAVQETLGPAQGPSPTSALFHRSKGKSAAKRKVKAKGLVRDARDRELELVSDPSIANAPEEGEVLDLADQLLEQLDAGAEVDAEVDKLAPPTALPGSRSSELSGTSSMTSDTSVHSHDSGLSSQFSNLGHTIKDGLIAPFSPPQGGTGRKVSRGQARKDRKEAEAEAIRQEARDEIANGDGRDPEAEERAGFDRLCHDKRFILHEIPPDGHCLFSAVADQLNLIGHRKIRTYNYHHTRKAAADYMRDHPDDFLPYLTIEDMVGDTQGPVSDGKFAKYCDAIESTGEWGGQTEILALSHVFQVPIEVYAADAPVVKNGEDYAANSPPARISFHQHMYGSGAHYSSLHPVSK